MDPKTAKVPLTFRIFRGDDLIRTETLTQSPIKIGKLASSHLRLEDDDSVSRMHAVIEVTSPTDITIIDLGSTKGTIVNGKKINKASLQDGDIILLGDTKIVLSIEEAEVGATPGPGKDDDEPTQVTVAPAPPVAAAPPPAPPPAAAAPPPAAKPVAPQPPTLPPPPRAAMPSPTPSPAQRISEARSVADAAHFGGDASADLHGRRAIEVAAMLTDSVVAVKHLTNPKSGKVSGFTYGLYAIGAALLLSSLTVFFNGVAASERNKRALHEWIEVEKQSAIDFHPETLPVWYDAVAILGFLVGVGSLCYALVRTIDEKQSPFFRIGSARGVEFPATGIIPGDDSSFTMVGPQGNDFVFSWAPGMKGEMTVDNQVTPIEKLPSTSAIPHKARIRVEAGNNTFFVSSVPAPRAPAGHWRFDSAMLVFALAALALHGGLVFLMYLLPADMSGYSRDDLDNDLRRTRVSIKPQEDPKAPENQSDDNAKSLAGGTGTKMALEEGKMGKKDSDRKTGQYQIQKVEGVDPQLARELKLEKARTAGVLGIIRAQQGGTFASLTATGDFSAGLDDRDIQGGLLGNEPGEMQGGWGYGISGVGAGGGGTGLGTIGTGRYGTIGHGSGTGTGYGIGSGAGGMRGRQPKQPTVSIGNATTVGELDKNTIRRYVRQKLSQIEYCYQKQLVVKPTLAGTVNTQFTIDGNGRVIASKAGGIGDGEVESCVAGVIRSIQFPKPAGGGIVNVTSYPFTFRPAGN